MQPSETTASKQAMTKIVVGLRTKADKIRALNKAGYPRADIARYLDVRYQHVRNVLVNSLAPRHEATETRAWAPIGPGGRVVIPAGLRQKIGIEDGDYVLMVLEDGEIRLVGRDAAIARAQTLVAKYVPAGVSLVGELLADRRRETAREARRE